MVSSCWMSTGYERAGRTQQKQRTRSALIEAARRLLDEGTVPTVDDAALAASISRATAYRYFSTQSELLLAASPDLTVLSLMPDDAPTHVDERVDAAVSELTRLTLQAEPALRAMLRASLAKNHAQATDLPLRRGRAVAWIEEALGGATKLDTETRHQLARAIRAATGIEALVWLTDVAGLSRGDAVALQRWSAQAMLRGALSGHPPPAPKRGGTSRGGTVRRTRNAGRP